MLKQPSIFSGLLVIQLRTSEDTLAITRRLDAILNVLLESMLFEGKRPTIRIRIRLLRQAGLRPSEIGRILGKTQQYVNSVLAQSAAREQSQYRRPNIEDQYRKLRTHSIQRRIDAL